jgi:hypothetical protein
MSMKYILYLLILCYSHCIPVQVFDNTPAAKDGTLQSGDELVGVNGVSVKGKTKVEVAKMIQASKVRNIEYSQPDCLFLLFLFIFHCHA